MKNTQQSLTKKKGWFKNMISNRNTSSNEISASGTMGAVVIIVGLLIFLLMTIFYMFNVTEAPNILLFSDKATTIVIVGGSLLGVRRFSSVFDRRQTDNGVSVTEAVQSMNQEPPIEEPIQQQVPPYPQEPHYGGYPNGGYVQPTPQVPYSPPYNDFKGQRRQYPNPYREEVFEE